MGNDRNSEGLFQDGSEVENFKITFGENLREIKGILDELDNQSGISVEVISSFVNEALTEVLINGFGGGEARLLG